MTVYCVDCKAAFEVDEGEEWKTQCKRCYWRRMRERERRERETWRSKRPEQPHEALARQATKLVQDAYQQGRKDAGRSDEQAVKDAWAAGYDEAAAAVGLDPGFVRDLVALCHPDRHPGRIEKATKATQRLLELLERKTTRRAA